MGFRQVQANEIHPGLSFVILTYEKQMVSYTVPRLECHQMVVIEYECSTKEEQVH